MFDYHPYGKILRSYVDGEEDRYLTTYHERDKETGLDYRGARFYDSEIGRFNSLDPLSADYPGLSPYNYTIGNPVKFIDPDGKAPGDPLGDKYGPGIRSGVKNAAVGAFNSTMALGVCPGCAITNLKNALSDPEQLVKNIAGGISSTFDKFQNGSDFDRGEVIGEIGGSIALGIAADKGLSKLGAAARTLNAVDKVVPDEIVGPSSKILNTSAKQLQKKFKHADDFGVSGSFSKANANKFNSAINQHINSSRVSELGGSYRGNPVTHYLDSETGLNVIAKPDNSFLSGWQLNPAQLENVLQHGGL